MKNIWKVIILTALMVTMGLGINTLTTNSASASSYTTAKSIRGHWYRYSRYDKLYYCMSIKAHSASTYQQHLSGRISYYKLYTPHMSGSHRLKITIGKHARKGSNTVYNLNNAKYDYQMIPSVWSSHMTIFGQRHHVLKSYYNMGAFNVYFHHKVKHDYSYTHLKHYQYFIGR
ncbi:hypothetical protein [Lentilactobacillus kefiri]|uniref:Uncharacterized protein n=2 Tax=Lentilactobacillus kefiri TaxID=33962 RepID=A0A511DWL2_LENKE|nr:hypothetical protein [Lentilactobacillus kefiri]MCJ2162433.1 hypothetical protein [Lentilactobacillus kefiri]MCP9369871.1 hypothetical protein [Lentilactobacillus kefiri]MDH5109509.1 hypothetical protein [Lentilactobacillus kefiri]PAK58503.1 hypothetical protein B9K02_11220 [Lentilactobacillus kefiri]PAK81930.1 hypothetical protein B8W85_09160 [Lentilactobacillus kefiri]